MQTLEEQLIELDSSYATTITNFSKYKHLMFLSSQFMELSKCDKNIFVIKILDCVCKSHKPCILVELS